MKKPITVKILVTVNDMAHFDACTLCFASLRVGWPTADIWVYLNMVHESNGRADEEIYQKVAAKLTAAEVESTNGVFHLIQQSRIHHADWIREQVNQRYPGPLVIADPDIVYWKSCEDWEFNEEILLAGYYNPWMWNDFARCISVPRIHTSMMVVPDSIKLVDTLEDAYPLAHKTCGEYCPCDPFMGRVMFDDGKPIFWDCCANLYNMLHSLEDGEDRLIQPFGPEHKACYDHLNSASFHAVMVQRLDPKHSAGFVDVHRDWVKNPRPGLWPLVDEYYKQKEIEGWMRQPGERTLKV